MMKKWEGQTGERDVLGVGALRPHGVLIYFVSMRKHPAGPSMLLVPEPVAQCPR